MEEPDRIQWYLHDDYWVIVERTEGLEDRVIVREYWPPHEVMVDVRNVGVFDFITTETYENIDMQPLRVDGAQCIYITDGRMAGFLINVDHPEQSGWRYIPPEEW
jgi:hypothetical protein